MRESRIGCVLSRFFASAFTACANKANAKGGFCDAFQQPLPTACPKLAETQTTCGNIVDAATFLCSSGATDAGGG